MEKLHNNMEIYAFRLGELTGKQGADILKRWGCENEKATLSELTAFFDGERLYINSEHRAFNDVKDLVFACIDSNQAARDAIYQKSPADVKDVMRVVEAYIEHEAAKAALHMIRLQDVTEGGSVLEFLLEQGDDDAIVDAFVWGVIQGKRAERARRRKATA